MKHITLLGLAAACTCTPAFCDWIQIGVPANSSQTLSTTGQSRTPTDADQFVVGTVSGCSGTAFCTGSGVWDFTAIGGGFLPAGSIRALRG